MKTRRAFLAIVLLAAGIAAGPALLAIRPGRTQLPSQLSNQEFWRIVEAFSEPGGTFHSDNFVSNEGKFQAVIPELLRRVRPGGLYVGVGPEQNFTHPIGLGDLGTNVGQRITAQSPTKGAVPVS